MKKVLLYGMACLYILAGINHFVHPTFYLGLIPQYIPYPQIANLIAGAAEIALGILLVPDRTRKLAAWGVILMLIAFLPTHIYMITHAPFKVGEVEITPIIAWVRLPLQLLLIYWAWIFTIKV